MYELIFWGALFIVLVIAESISLQLVSIWFAVGSAAAFIASLFRAPILAQIILFLVISTLLLIFTRPIVRKAKATHKPTNADAVIGKEGVVTEKIDNLRGVGRVQVDGLSWNARSEDNLIIEKDAVIQIGRIEGVTVFVKEVKASN